MNGHAPAYAARPATFDDLEEIGGLLNQLFGTPPRLETLRWKFGGPAGRLVGSAVLTHRRSIVGFLGQMPVRVCALGHEFPAAQGADVGVLAEHRRLDAFLNLVRVSIRELENAGVALTYGVANAQATVPLSSLLGQRQVAPTPLLVRPLTGAPGLISAGLSLVLPRLQPAWAGGATQQGAQRREARGAERRTVHLSRFDSRFDRFWRHIRDDCPIMLMRDAAFLNWRYGAGSGAIYERLAVEQAVSGEIEGYAVLSITRRNGQVRGRLCDLVTARQSDPGAAKALIRGAVAWFHTQGAELADVWMFAHTPLRSILRRHGFFPCRTGPGGLHASALTHAFSARIPSLDRPSNWHLALGDSDSV